LAKGWKVGLGYIDAIESTLDAATPTTTTGGSGASLAAAAVGQPSKQHFKINLYCKDFNVIQLASLPGHDQTTESCAAMVERLQELTSGFRASAGGDDAPACVLKRALDAQEGGFADDGWTLYDARAELERLGFGQEDDPHWRLTDINADYGLCKTYPRFVQPTPMPCRAVCRVCALTGVVAQGVGCAGQVHGRAAASGLRIPFTRTPAGVSCVVRVVRAVCDANVCVCVGGWLRPDSRWCGATRGRKRC
jgi:hypothetical protein